MSYFPMYQEKDIDQPVEQLFASIFQLQILDEYDTITNALKQELEKFFEDMEEKDGKKKIKSILYYPNGLCEWQNKTEKIILKPWQNKTEVKNAIKRDYTLIKRANLIWYVQFMQYLKKPIRVSHEKVAIREIVDFTKRYQTLSEAEKPLFLDERIEYHEGKLERELDKLRNFFRIASYYSRDDSMEHDRQLDELRLNYKTFRLLNEAQLQDLKDLFESSITDRWQFESKLNKLLSESVSRFFKEDESMTSIDFSDLLKPTKNRVETIKNGWSSHQIEKKKYTFDFENSTDAAMAILNRFSEVEDEKLQKVLKKLGI